MDTLTIQTVDAETIRVIELPRNCVIVVPALEGDGIDGFREALNDLGRSDVLLVVGMDVKVLDPDEMRRCGWVRTGK